MTTPEPPPPATSPAGLLPGFPYGRLQQVSEKYRARVGAAQDIVGPLRSHAEDIGGRRTTLAERTGLSLSTVKRILDGAVWPRADAVALMARAYGLDLQITRDGYALDLHRSATELRAQQRDTAAQEARHATAEELVRRLDDPATRATVAKRLTEAGWQVVPPRR